MEITLHQIKIRELAEGYQDLSVTEEGIVGFGGRLNIRPKYQREFVYDDKKRMPSSTHSPKAFRSM